MKYRLSSHAKRQLSQIAGLRNNSDADIDELLGLMLQLSLALMMIFMIGFCLFRLNTNQVMRAAEEQRQEQLLTEQRQQLIMALEKTEDFFLTRYGLKVMAEITPESKLVYNGGMVIDNGQLSANAVLRNAFVQGAANVYADYSDRNALLEQWRQQVAQISQLDVAVLQSGNREWLSAQLDGKINAVLAACREVQTQAAVAVQNYLADHPSEARSDRVKSLLDQYVQAPEEQRKILLTELNGVLKRYAFEYLKTQTQCPMLEELP